jgi:hypothetical protein
MCTEIKDIYKAILKDIFVFVRYILLLQTHFLPIGSGTCTLVVAVTGFT